MVRSTLANLSSSGAIVLFTPVIIPAGAGKATNKTASIDPFETLGRALSAHHKRIRHVPYLPSKGFTETHDAFLSQADAVVIVVCEPSSSKHESVGSQVDFAEAAQEEMSSNRIGRTPEDGLILVQCGDPQGSFWPKDLAQFENVIKCRAYSPEMGQQIAKKLFEARK